MLWVAFVGWGLIVLWSLLAVCLSSVVLTVAALLPLRISSVGGGTIKKTKKDY